MKLTMPTYRHYKGGIYTIVTEAKLESDPSQIMVIYKSEDGQVWCRPKEVFFQKINVNDVEVERFSLIE